jgi:hypothetical protein
VQLAVQAQEATVAGAGHSPARVSAGVRVVAEPNTPPASPLAAASLPVPTSPPGGAAVSRADADELASEAMRAVQAEDLGKAARLMGKAARAFPAEYGEAFELIETARRSVGAEMEPDSPVATAPPSFADAKPAAGAAASTSSAAAAAGRAREKLNEAASPVAAPPPPSAGTPHGTPERKAHRSGGKHRGGGGGASPEKMPARPTGATTPPPAARRAPASPADAATSSSSPSSSSEAPATASDDAAPAAGAPAEDGAPAADDADAPTNWTWSMVAVALWHVWSAFVEEYLPLVPEAAGCGDLEHTLRDALQRGSPARNRIVAATSAVAALLLALAVALALALARVALGWAAAALTFAWQLTVSLVRAVAWEPVWWAALPACLVAGTQSHITLIAHFWASPAWWWLLGGRKWAALGTALALGTQLLLGSVPSWLAIVAWTLLRGACVFSSLWLRVPAVGIVLAAWAFTFILWLHALAAAARNSSESVPPGELPADVPDDAEGEVARILGCRHYYDVLELDMSTDEEAVRKAHRRKALLVHPDKCASAHAQLAFQRVQDAFQLLKGALFSARVACVHCGVGPSN